MKIEIGLADRRGQPHHTRHEALRQSLHTSLMQRASIAMLCKSQGKAYRLGKDRAQTRHSAAMIQIYLAILEPDSTNARMIERQITTTLTNLLDTDAAVTLIGPHGVGKSRLALTLAQERPTIYLDLGSEADRAKLIELELYLERHGDKLVILDEVHRLPNLFHHLHDYFERRRRIGREPTVSAPKPHVDRPAATIRWTFGRPVRLS